MTYPSGSGFGGQGDNGKSDQSRQAPDWGSMPPPSAYPMQAWETPPQPPAPERRTGVIVALAVGVVAVLGAVVGIGVSANSRVQGHAQAAASAEATTRAGGVTSTRPATPAPGGTHPSSGRLSYTEFAEDWDFRFDRVELHADWVDGRDHADCHPIEVAGKLTSLGCGYAAELVYRAEGGALMLTQFVLGMADRSRAAAAKDRFTDADLTLRPGTYIKGYATGKWKDGSEKEFVVVTLATATGAVDPATVEKYLRYRHADTIGALAFR
ncbi:hypothetical protein [Nocardia gamkensis]|uniref:Uncharacterized protein n=1 Tax=Nocardia gamkensis TaxID=352869 RepID=A0A7X6L918_9NOCA|nr:hypothetical protein [Nocardia gamkensis]NKY29885.1 hypothetical protein [Nocardia gamkensis]NQE69920.1 hypothetical protein [Nocardia gamkensis]